MPFFEDIDELKMAQRHAESVLKLEEAEAKRLMGFYRKIRRDLRDRLDFLDPDAKATFTAQRMRGVLLQVELAIQAIQRDLNIQMGESAGKITKKGVDDLAAEIRRFSKEFEGAVQPIDLDVVRISLDTQNFLVNQYEVSIRNYSEGVRQVLTQQITKAAIEEIPLAELIQRMSRFFAGEEWKLLRIARTELHNVYNLSKLNGMKEARGETIPDLQKALFHPIDHRTADDSKQLAVLNPVVPIGKPFEYIYRRKRKDGSTVREKRTFMAPPERPNDRGILVPYREAWDLDQQQAVNA